ncbi:MAG: OmpH family outer membrane protein [Ignavibacteriae bacterium]|nr:OmpH family outer membrane protein [Ignavibacteriota bacterium]NOG97011.1 OmpH family outer membrane protein [Ignavibacteriota bacterium]
MKKALLIFSIVLFVFGTVNAQSSQKIGFVNSQVIFAQLPAAIKVQSDLDAMIQQWQNSLDSMTQDLQAAYADYQQKEATMAADKQQEAQQLLVGQQQRMEQFRQEKFSQPNGEAFVKQEEMLAPIRTKVIKAIDDIAAQEKMNFVFDKSESIPLLLHADDEFDITFKVLDKLKRGK